MICFLLCCFCCVFVLLGGLQTHRQNPLLFPGLGLHDHALLVFWVVADKDIRSQAGARGQEHGLGKLAEAEQLQARWLKNTLSGSERIIWKSNPEVTINDADGKPLKTLEEISQKMERQFSDNPQLQWARWYTDLNTGYTKTLNIEVGDITTEEVIRAIRNWKMANLQEWWYTSWAVNKWGDETGKKMTTLCNQVWNQNKCQEIGRWL